MMPRFALLALFAMANAVGVSAGDLSGGPVRQGGDTIEQATIIPGLPFHATGSTVGFENDYEEECPWSGGTAADVVYVYSPSVDVTIDISSCGPLYDTKLYVYEDEFTPGAPLACNDDLAGCPEQLYVAWIRGVGLVGGHDYYIVVDGWANHSGGYWLHVVESPVGETCDPTDYPVLPFFEDETDCHDDYVDEFNSGCESPLEPFTHVPSTVLIAGKSGTFNGNTSMDSDWYQILVEHSSTVTFLACAGYPMTVWLFEGGPSCPPTDVLSQVGGDPFLVFGDGVDVEPGPYWFAVHPTEQWGTPCGADYLLYIETHTSASRLMDWGALKSMYR